MLRAAMRSLLRVGFLWAVLGLVAGGCDQEEGEPCQTDRDCASGLECNRAVGSDRGECVQPMEAPPVDGPDGSSAPDDAGAGDADGG